MQIWRDTHATNSQSELQHTGGCRTRTFKNITLHYSSGGFRGRLHQVLRLLMLLSLNYLSLQQL